MPTTTTTYSFNKPVVGADEDDWGGYLNGNWDSVDDLLDGTTPITGIDINSGTLDGVTIGGTTAGAGTFTTLTANTSITGTLATAAQPNITSVGTLTGLTVSASASLAGASTSADITFGDNDKAIFGAGSDLQIYHDGTDSVINESTAGNLLIQGDNLYLQNPAGSSTYIRAKNGLEVDLRYNGSVKLATTSTGVDITGTLTSDGLTVSQESPKITITDTGTGADHELNGASSIGNLTLNFDKNDEGSSPYFYIQHAGSKLAAFRKGGDISFYEDTGTTAKFFWDASAESLGIGTSSPAQELDVNGQVRGVDRYYFKRASDNYSLSALARWDGSTGSPLTGTAGIHTVVGSEEASSSVIFAPSNTERMRINSSGQVFVGFDNAAYANGDLVVGKGAASGNSTLGIQSSGSANLNKINFGDGGRGDRASIISGATNYLAFSTFDGSSNTTERMRIDSSGNVGIGTTSPSNKLHVQSSGSGTVALFGDSVANNYLAVTRTTTNPAYVALSATSNVGGLTAGSTLTLNTSASDGTSVTERMRIDSSGNLLVGTTDTSVWNNSAGSNADFGFTVIDNGYVAATSYSQDVMYLNRTGTDGSILQFRKDGTTVGFIGTVSSRPYIGVSDTAIRFKYGVGDAVIPANGSGGLRDNQMDVGAFAARWDDIYATNGTINTSDRNEKQDIAELSDAEQRVAVAAKGLLRKFRWRDAVEEKGDEARTHFGIIAQDLQAAFAAEGLDAGDYAMFIHSTWTDEETGEEKSRMGVRYSELLAFIIAAI